MKETKFTPGPWHVTNGMPFIHTENHKEVCKINCDVYQEGDFNIIDANARLISYSPDMYEALEAMHNYFEILNTGMVPAKIVNSLKTKVQELLTKIKEE